MPNLGECRLGTINTLQKKKKKALGAVMCARLNRTICSSEGKNICVVLTFLLCSIHKSKTSRHYGLNSNIYFSMN